ncbi:MAG: 16S rRNA (adenine(1518)-N(6)/adenine(1519)-N(6))-dimethyltransferase RsmA [Ruminococcaceae bacterium]|nr:16S rRNA (adenine(1518)-N(6)/adenine(1519)-N(6))-dimethyltransferase RsmA [Oscillospiraceae bacterium]
MRNLSDINVIKSVMGKHGVTFNKGLGQNFLVDPEVCPAMAEAAGLDENTCAIEIGPGVGVLTAELAKRAGKVLSFEVDKRLLPVLDETLSDFNNVEIINEDVMKADLPKIIEEKCKGMEIAVVANLPYYITSPIIMLLLESKLLIKSITVMVQKEAADRLCAEVGSRDGGAVTVAVSYYAESEKLFFVPRESFLPPPKVNSEVIQLTIRKEPPVKVENEEFFFKLVKAAFSQRRKTAENSISAGLGINKNIVAEALEKAGLERTVRAEKLTMEDFATLAEFLEN